MESNRIIQSDKAKPILYEIPSDDEGNQAFDEEEVDRENENERSNKKSRIDTHNTLLSTVLHESNENTVNHAVQPASESITIINDDNTSSTIETVLPIRISPRSSTPLSIKDVTIKPDKTTNPTCIRIAFSIEGASRHKFQKQGELENSCRIEARNMTTGSPTYFSVKFTVLCFSTRPQIELSIGLGESLMPSVTYALRLVHKSDGAEKDILYLTQHDDLLSIPSYSLFYQYECSRRDTSDLYSIIWTSVSGHRSHVNTDKNAYVVEYLDITGNSLMGNIISSGRVEDVEELLSELNRQGDSDLDTIKFLPLHKAGYFVSLAYDEDDVQLKLSINYGISNTFKPNHMYVIRLCDPYSDWYYIPYIFMEPLVPTRFATDTHSASGHLNIIGHNYDPPRTSPSASSASTSTSSSSSTAPTSVAPPPVPAIPTGAATAPLCVGCANEANMLLKPCGHAFICEPCCDIRFKQPMKHTILCPHCPPDTSVAVDQLVRYTKPDRKCRNMVEKCDNNANTVLSTCGHMVYCDTCVNDYAVCGVFGCSTPYTKADVVKLVVR